MKLRFLPVLAFALALCGCSQSSRINRKSVVTRHNIEHSNIDSLSPLTVGNGEFAFTADITGLQSFPEHYEGGIPLGTQSQWGWHSFPNNSGYTLEDVKKNYWNGKDSIPYWYQFGNEGAQRQQGATKWLRENPHRLHLGLIGLELKGVQKISELEDPSQSLDLWTGALKSLFMVTGKKVEVETFCDQKKDRIYIKVRSELVASGDLKLKLRFPYARHEKFSSGYDFNVSELHKTEIADQDSNQYTLKRTLDETTYYVHVNSKNRYELRQSDDHNFLIKSRGESSEMAIAIEFSEMPNPSPHGSFDLAYKHAENHWETFWGSGAAIDFSEASDPRASELERRVVLSQYLTKIQCTGQYPAQETGLTFNSWHGKFHLEMHWWHAMHFIKWGRFELIEAQLEYYKEIYEQAKKIAEYQGFDGVRWPKMIDPSGRESPSSIGTFLIWQQPHIIYLTEEIYKKTGDGKALRKFKDLVFSTADFMADYARWDERTQRYVLGPALIPAQERFHPETTVNPSFELAYWYWGLKTALEWQDRLGIERDKKWQHVLDNLSVLSVKGGNFLFTEDGQDSYENPIYLTDHPIVLGALGFVPNTDFVDSEIMERTQQKVLKLWNWETIWGWDVPLAAMNAAALGQPDQAIDFLLMDTPKNTYLMNGHNYQHEILPIYLPGNGGLLAAVGMMCETEKGFPQDGKWKVKHEGFQSIH